MQELKDCPFCGEMPELCDGDIIQCENCDIRIYTCDAWNHRVGKLPEGMERCTILFKECEKGHGRLTALNWIDHGCPHCKIEELSTPMRESRYRDSDIGRQPIATAPKGVPVLVAGGLAMKKTGGEWFSGIEEPLYQRPLQWTPTWWMPIPRDNARRGSDAD